MMVIVFAYVKIGPVEETQVSETTVVELNKVDPQWTIQNHWKDALNVMGHYFILDQWIKNAVQIVDQNLIGI